MQIKSNCCAFGGPICNEVHVPLPECPVKRQNGARDFISSVTGERVVDVTCIYHSAFGAGVPACKYYGGVNRRKDGYFVNCTYDSQVEEIPGQYR